MNILKLIGLENKLFVEDFESRSNNLAKIVTKSRFFVWGDVEYIVMLTLMKLLK